MTFVVHDDPPLQACIDVLTTAFAREPAAIRFCGTNARRRATWFDALLRTHATLNGQRLLVTRGGRPIAVAVATAPGGRPALAAQLIWSWRTLRRCGPRALVGTATYISRTEAWKPDHAWVLEFVGVLPEARGNVLARQLFERAEADYPGSPAFLTTADPRNVPMYQQWGFEVSEQASIAGLTVASMTRQALV